MAEFKMDAFAKRVGDMALEQIEYEGKTLTEWIHLIASNEFKPVVKGKWINIHDNKGDCSACGEKDLSVWMNFCPICGADMRTP